MSAFALIICTTVSASPPDPVDHASEVVKAYHSQLGVREATGANDGVEVEKYLASVNLGKGYAWCAAFVKWTFDQANVRTTITAWSPTAQSKNLVYFKNKFLHDPQPGDVFCLYFPRLKRIAHTGFYDGSISKTVYRTVEGNTNEQGSREGDGVYKKYRSFKSTYSISRWITT